MTSKLKKKNFLPSIYGILKYALMPTAQSFIRLPFKNIPIYVDTTFKIAIIQDIRDLDGFLGGPLAVVPLATLDWVRGSDPWHGPVQWTPAFHPVPPPSC
jgi:hypothetical protein